VFGHPALRLLFWLKLRGGLRMQVRKLRRPSSWIFLIVGGLLVFGWILAVIFGRSLDTARAPVAPEILRLGVDFGLLVLVVLTLVGAFQYRGLYLPREEIELSFSAPLSRSQLVRYRMATNLMRSLFAALLFGFLASRRLPNGLYAFLGTFLVMMTIPIFGQALALALGETENRLGKFMRRVPLRFVSVVLGAAVGIAVVFLIITPGPGMPRVLTDGTSWLADLGQHPFVRAALLPVAPWGRMITATSAGEFLPWFTAGVGAWILLHEMTARIRIDYRELSLATSADVARRVAMARRGGWSASKSQVMQPVKGSGAPWLFGRGGFGAIAWLETTSMLRRARGTLLLSLMVVVLLVVLTGSIGRGGEGAPWRHDSQQKSLLFGSLLISMLGTIYLCAGLRFDFRGRLEQMELVKAWPLAPWRIFTATILPETLFVSGLVVLAVAGRAVWMGAFHPVVLAVIAFQPLVVLTWVALDNAVFLHSPVRYVPGQESALQHMGRSLVLMLLRMLVLGIVVVVGLAPAAGLAFLLHGVLGVEKQATTAAAAAVAWVGIVAVDVGLVWFGGRMLARFDVARDKGV